jgi:hypothetical protein
VDVQVVSAGTLEDTEQVIAEVPISPIWVGKRGKGIYAIPPVDALVIVGFIAWNPAYPYITGIWSDEYEAGAFKKGELVITNGEGLRWSIGEDSRFTFENKEQNLKGILEKLIDEIAAIQTQGGPPQHILIFSMKYTIYLRVNSLYYKELISKYCVYIYEKFSSITGIGY